MVFLKYVPIWVVVRRKRGSSESCPKTGQRLTTIIIRGPRFPRERERGSASARSCYWRVSGGFPAGYRRVSGELPGARAVVSGGSASAGARAVVSGGFPGFWRVSGGSARRRFALLRSGFGPRASTSARGFG